MNRTVRLLVVVLSLASQPLVAADIVHASRYIQTLTRTGNPGIFAPVDQAILLDYCQDADGCKVSLRAAETTELVGRSTRLYIAESVPSLWFSETDLLTNATKHDDDLNSDAVLNTLTDSSFCGFTDADGASDSEPGFALSAASAEDLTVICTLVIED